MKVGARTDRGKIREQNEDAFGYHDSLFVIADGMGGHEAGEIASAVAVETILAAEYNSDILSCLEQAILKANQAILKETEKDESYSGMGTTVAVLLLEDNQAYIAHVGDSRIYRLSGGNLVQLTDDHSFVAELLKNGSITEEEAKIHPQRNILTQALGTNGKLTFEVNVFPLQEGDKFLLCSDGLTGMVDERMIKFLLEQSEEPRVIVDQLIEKANEQGGNDNITVIVIEV